MPTRSIRLAALAPVGLFAVACFTLASFGQPERGQPEGRPPAGDRQPGPREGGPREGGPGARGGQRPEPQNVEGCMKAMNRGMRALRDQLKPETKDQALQTIWQVEKYAVAAKSMEPEHMKGGKTPETLAAYRKGQIELIEKLLKLEGQVLDGKMDEAQQTYAAIGQYKKQAHDQFQVEEDDRGGPERR